eukprot:TRINITY_DN3394_c0_g3_i2.p1 TRINITY_DN3394_c0_g3~~TRINITY_DN3394_c0_g3_i2.p1  ORF type:complete len:1167 (-),score=114.54 TRINITY_DN3394_c0_g3_i2:813-4313(-)
MSSISEEQNTQSAFITASHVEIQDVGFGNQKSPSRTGTPQALGPSQRAQKQVLGYRLGKLLGQGAYGQVFEGTAVDPSRTTTPTVAVKQISLAGIQNEQLAGIVQEIELLKSLKHPNIVKYFNSFLSKRHLYILLEYMDNGTLSQVLKPGEFGSLAEPLVAMYIIQVLEGLMYLHQQGVVHRDIKGANILMSKAGDVKLADFGVATTRDEIEAAGTLSDQVVGTPYWMAPEVIEMTSVTSACDIWSVGCLIIELLTGSPPYYDLQPMSALYRIVQDDNPPLPRAITLDLRDFLLKCFQKDPQNRPSAAILLQHKWIKSNIEPSTIKSSWSRVTQSRNTTINAKNAHESVKNVVARFLEVKPEDLQLQGSLGSKELLAPQTPSASSQMDRPVSGSTEIQSQSIRNRSRGRVVLEDDIIQQDIDISPIQPIAQEGTLVPQQQFSGEADQECENQPLDSRQQLHTKLKTIRDDTASAHLVLRQSGLNSIEREMLSWLDETVSSRDETVMQQQQEGNESDSNNTQDVDQRRSERQAVRELVRKLQLGQRGNVQSVTQALKGLRERFQRYQHQRQYFLSEGGAVTLMELLDSGISTLVLGALELINEVAMDSRTLEQLMLVGIVPVVMGLSVERGVEERLRVQAITFMHRMCTCGDSSAAHTFLCCNGLYFLVEILRVKDYRSNGRLVVHSVLECIHTLLRAQNIRRGNTPIPLNHFSRLLAKNGFVGVLIRYMEDAANDVKQHKLQAQKQHNVLHSKQRSEPASPLAQSSHNVPKIGSGAASDSLATLAKQLHQQSQNLHRQRTESSEQSESTSASPSRPSGAGHRSTMSATQDTGVTDSQILYMMVQLLAVIGVSDTVVLSFLCERSSFEQLLLLINKLPKEYVEHAIVCIQSASRDPEVHDLMSDSGAIPKLVKFLETEEIIELGYCQLSLLAAVENLCKLSKARQEVAVASGIAPILIKLALSSPQDELARKCRYLAIKLILSFAICSTKTRQVLWLSCGFDALLDLLREAEWQIGVLEVLATWLREDPARRVQQKVTQESTQLSLVRILKGLHQSVEKEDQFVRILTPLQALTKGKEVAHALCKNNDFVLYSVKLLIVAEQNQFMSGCRSALGLLRNLYKFHHNPKEFVVRFKVREAIRPLLNVETQIVRRAAEELMDAFSVNYIF